MATATEDFDPDDQAILAQFGLDTAPQATPQQATSEQPGDETTTTTAAAPAAPAAAPAASPASAPAAEAPAEAPAADAEKQGDVRAALRASRRSESRAREENARLAKEVEDLRAKVPKAATDVTDEELAELEVDMPIVAKALRETRAKSAAATPAPAPQAEPKAEFIPPTQAEHVQEMIDDIPALLAMQNNPDQTAFLLAVKTDETLQQHPAWKDKPLPERLAECARRVQADLGIAAAPQPPASPPAPAAPVAPVPPVRRDPAQAIAAAPKAAPVSTLSDLRGGAAPANPTLGVSDYLTMSDDEILDSLR